MSELIEEKLEVAESKPYEPFNLKTAYDYLNRLSFTVHGTSTKSLELLSCDAICLIGESRMTNIMLTKIAVNCLMPKKYGGFKNSKVFILDAGNCTDVYQFVDFMKQYGLNIKKSLRKIMISRVFTVYQLTHFLKYELLKTVHEYRTNMVIIPDLLSMFLQEPEIDVQEVEFLLREIIEVLKLVSAKNKVLLITSLSLNNESSHHLSKLVKTILEIFNKSIEIDKNKTNEKFKILLHEKQGTDYVTVKKYLSVTAEDVLTVIR
jgi:septum formation topological specificity factor MinE